MVTGTSVGVWSVSVLTCSYGCVLFVYITDVGGGYWRGLVAQVMGGVQSVDWITGLTFDVKNA